MSAANADSIREGEVRLPFDPAASTDGPRVSFIGHIRSPWQNGNAPRNISQARETGQSATIELMPGYAPGLTGLSTGQYIIVLYWMDRAPRNHLIQNPRHVDGTRGTFALRSPARPNPIAMSTVQIMSIDHDGGAVGIDAIDCFDGTPVVDIKPWIASVDQPPPAVQQQDGL